MNVTATLLTDTLFHDHVYYTICVVVCGVVCTQLVSTGISFLLGNKAGCLGCTGIKDCAVVMQLLEFCLKGLFYWK